VVNALRAQGRVTRLLRLHYAYKARRYACYACYALFLQHMRACAHMCTRIREGRVTA